MSNSLLNGMFITPPSKTSQTALQYAGYRSSRFRPPCIQTSARASTERITKAKNVARIGIHNNPEPTAIPIAAVSHRPAAVVRPLISCCSVNLRIVPAPMNPMPVAIP